MGTAQDFDAIDIQKIEHGPLGAAYVNAIHINADLRVLGGRPIHLPNPAKKYLGRVLGGASLLEVHVRGDAHQVAHLVRSPVLEVLARQGGNRNRHLLNVLLPAAGGDQEFLNDP